MQAKNLILCKTFTDIDFSGSRPERQLRFSDITINIAGV